MLTPSLKSVAGVLLIEVLIRTRHLLWAWAWRLLLVLTVLISQSGFSGDSTAASTWVLIDTHHATLTVMRNDEAVAHFNNISIGRRGAASIHMQGDDTTPLGTFRIISRNTASPYKLFFGLDYPTPAHAELALKNGKIEAEHHRLILSAHARNQIPPSSTPLGGAIGIHGIGAGSLSVHHQYNWTNGCIALDNQQIQEFARWVTTGVYVNIQ
ncbi:MAG: L,D-transpeptidase [Porticoccaceae bacterium]